MNIALDEGAYVSLFSRHHIAMLDDWLRELGQLFVYLDFPHSGGSGSSYSVKSLEELKRLIRQQTHPEIQIHIFRSPHLSEDELAEYDKLPWTSPEHDRVLRISVWKNRNWYAAYHANPEQYDAVIRKWYEDA